MCSSDLEAAQPNGKGINHYLYGVLCLVLWVTLIDVARRALNLMRVQGSDEVMQSQAAYIRKAEHAAA